MILMEGTRRANMLHFPIAYTVLLPGIPQPGERFPLTLCLHDLGADRQQLVQAAGSAQLPERLRMALVIPDGRRTCFLDLAHGPCWNTFLHQELLPQLCSSLPCDASNLSVLGVGTGALGALMLARAGLSCALIDPCTTDVLSRDSIRWPREEEWLSLFDGQTPVWRPGQWRTMKGLVLGNAQSLTSTTAQLTLAHWDTEPCVGSFSNKLARALAWLNKHTKE